MRHYIQQAAVLDRDHDALKAEASLGEQSTVFLGAPPKRLHAPSLRWVCADCHHLAEIGTGATLAKLHAAVGETAYAARVTSPRSIRLATAVLAALCVAALAGCASATPKTDAAATAPAKPAAAAQAASPAPSTTAPTPTPTPTPTASSAPLSAAQQRQVSYALRYWKNYNSAVYGNDNPNGGDCANFVSQTLIQRGWTMNSTWYNHGQGAMSGAWAYVPAMLSYFQANAKALGIVELGEGDRSSYAVGDVVMFWWKNADGSYSTGPDHVQVIDRVTTTGGKVTVEMASHNDDVEYRDLDHEITVEHPGAKFVVWHLTRDTNS